MADFYIIDEVRSEIREFVSKNNFEGARQLFTERIMDWTDYFMENLHDARETEDGIFAIRSICQLWIDYAEMEIDQKQYKKASQVFDKAIEDPIAKSSSSIYLRYSSFCEVINKLGHAKSVLVRGLCSQLAQADADLLWAALLSVAKKSGSPSLTMKLLYDAIVLEKSAESVTKPSEAALESSASDSGSLSAAPTGAIDNPRDNMSSVMPLADTSAAPATSLSVDTLVLAPSSHVLAAGVTRDYDDVSFLTPEQLTNTFVTRPPMLFNFSEQEVDGAVLTEPELRELEAYFGQGLPRDAAEFQAHASDKLRVVADTIEGLWAAQALKERHFNHWFSELQALHMQNKRDPLSSDSRADVQLEVLHCVVNKTLYALLVEQETVMAGIKFPRFTKEHLDGIVRKYDSAKAAEIVANQRRFIAAVARLSFNLVRGNVSALDPEGFYSLEAKNSRRKRRMG